MSVAHCLSAPFRMIADCESCTWPISTYPTSKEAGELRLSSAWDLFRRTPPRVCLGYCAAVVLYCVLNAATLRLVVVSRFFFHIERTRPTASIVNSQPCLIYRYNIDINSSQTGHQHARTFNASSNADSVARDGASGLSTTLSTRRPRHSAA